MKKYVIARCSSVGQKLDSQIAELKKAHPDHDELITGFRSSVSAKNKAELQRYIDMCDEGDSLVFLRLSRVSRSLTQSLWFFAAAEKKKINVILVKEKIDFSTPAGRFQAHMMMVFYQYQKEIQLENAREGRRHAESKKDFKGWGKPSSLSDKRVKAIRKARHEKNRTLKDIAEEYGISVSYAHRLTNDEKRKQYNEAHKARQREKYAEAN